MADKKWKVVFSGDLAFDTDIDEVRKNLADQCHFKPETIEKILANPKIAIRKGLDTEKANRYKDFFDRLGLLCDIVAETPQTAPEPISLKTTAKPATVLKGYQCPKCGETSQNNETCEHCGIIFKRYEAAQQRLQNGFNEPEIFPTEPSSPPFQWQQALTWGWAQFLVLIAVILVLRGPLHNFLSLALVLTSVGLTAIVLFQSSETGESLTDVLYDHCTLLWHPKDQTTARFPDIPIITLLLAIAAVAAYLILHYLLEPALIVRHLVFMPANTGIIHIILVPITALILHISPAHLCINIIFIWICGSFLEKQCGKTRLILMYMLGGILAEIIYLLFYLMAGTWPQWLGSSGAVATLLGVSLTLLQHRTIEFPLPFVSLLAPKWEQYLTIRLNKHVVVGLFFLSVSPATTTAAPVISGHLGTVAGLLCGMLLGKFGGKKLVQKHAPQTE